MKVLFWAIVIAFVYWAWRRSRSAATPQKPPAASAVQDMVTCVHCGVHLPKAEAISGTRGPYCSPSHRSAAGDRNPD